MTDDASPRPLTAAEAERLSVARFNNYDEGVLAFELTLTAEGEHYDLTGRVDYREHLAYAIVDNRTQALRSLLQANLATVATREHDSDRLPTEPPDDGWQRRPLAPRDRVVDAALSLLLSLGADRPENPVLLRQNGAQWYGETTIGATPVDEMSGPDTADGPTRVRYFVDETGQLVRFSGALGGGSERPVTIDFSPSPTPSVPAIDPLP